MDIIKDLQKEKVSTISIFDSNKLTEIGYYFELLFCQGLEKEYIEFAPFFYYMYHRDISSQDNSMSIIEIKKSCFNKSFVSTNKLKKYLENMESLNFLENMNGKYYFNSMGLLFAMYFIVKTKPTLKGMDFDFF